MATITVKESAGDYTSLDGALDNASDSDTISIEGLWASADGTIGRTIANDNLTITCDADSRNLGYPFPTAGGSGPYRTSQGTSGHLITISGTGTTIENIDLCETNTGTSLEVFRNSQATAVTLTVKNSVLGCIGWNDEQDIFYSDVAGTGTLLFENCMFYNAKRAVVDLTGSVTDWVIDFNSCTALNIGDTVEVATRRGIVGFGGGTGDDVTIQAKNCLFDLREAIPAFVASLGAGTCTITAEDCVINQSDFAFYFDTETLTRVSVSQTITASTAASAYIVGSLTEAAPDPRLTDHANNLAQDDSDIDATGAGLTIPSTDIIGTSRPQNTDYDLGAFEIAAAGDLSIDISQSVNVTENLTLAAESVEQEGFRWRDDDGSESGAAWLENQDVDAVIAIETNIRLRFLLNATGDPASKQYKLQYKKTSDSTWLDMPETL